MARVVGLHVLPEKGVAVQAHIAQRLGPAAGLLLADTQMQPHAPGGTVVEAPKHCLAADAAQDLADRLAAGIADRVERARATRVDTPQLDADLLGNVGIAAQKISRPGQYAAKIVIGVLF